MPFADELIGPYTAQMLYRAIRAARPDADLTALSAAPGRLPDLALRARADLLADALLEGLPGDYAGFASTIREASRRGGISGWSVWPVTSAIARKALDDGHDEAFDDGLALLADLTGLLTSEFAIRGFLRHDLDRALERVLEWTISDAPDVRRLASEGTRPYLPWSVRVPEITQRSGITVPILDRLYRDESEYVRRSVANHLNDLSRESPGLVVATAARWLGEPDDNTARLVRHGLRTLVKRGHPGALSLLGFRSGSLDVTGPTLESDAVAFGGSVRFTAVIRNAGDEPARLSIDYVVHHVRADASTTAKTFKLTTRTLEAGDSMALAREHSFRAITKRRYYPGLHAIELQVNGVLSGRVAFELLPSESEQD